MAGSHRPYEPNQVTRLPAAQQDRLPGAHWAHFINGIVDELDLKTFYARYDLFEFKSQLWMAFGFGRNPWHLPLPALRR
jgi:hypothetical protein